MAHAHSDVYAKDVTVKVECSGEIGIHCGGAMIFMEPSEAVALRDALSRTIVEAATAAAQAVQTEGEAA